MKLPSMANADGITAAVQSQFGGYNHSPGAKNGELWDMENLTGDQFPLLSPRRQRILVRTLDKPNGIFSNDAMCWVDGTTFYYGGEEKGQVSDGEKTFAAMGNYILIFPDKKYYNKFQDQFGDLEASISTPTGGARFENGMLYEEEAMQNAITCSSIDFTQYFSPGDGVTISGCTKIPANNKTAVLREISEDGHSLYFYEFAFTLDGEEGKDPYNEPGEVTIARTVPDMDYVCVNENRLWGCKGDEVFCSALGDPKNFNVFDGVATDAWSTPAGSAGDFTGCVSYLGYPVFFKEDHIYKVYGDYAQSYRLMGSATTGVANGSGKSLAVAGELLMYLSPAGVMSYSGGIPSPLFAQFGLDRYKNGVAGSDGVKYYLSMEGPEGRFLFVYDTGKNMWHKEDGFDPVGFARHGDLYGLSRDGKLWDMAPGLDAPDGTLESQINWSAEWADIYEGGDTPAPNKKGITKLLVRLDLEEGSTFSIQALYDSRGEWETVAELTADRQRSYYLPMIPRRVDHYRLKMSGTGPCLIRSLTREYYSGSNLRSTKGRQ